MKLGFLFAGQGAQYVGMGRDLYESEPDFRARFDRAAAVTGLDLAALCFDGPEETLAQTRYTQPCMVAVETGIAALLERRGIRPQAVAGLSLGEYAALCCAGAFDSDEAVRLATFRGEAMEKAVAGRPSGMAVVLGLDRDTLAAACMDAADKSGGVVEIANYNCPGQMAIAGDAAAVEAACIAARQAGAKRCLPLKVSGPFHTSLMGPAGDALCERFKQTVFAPLHCTVYFNCLGGPDEAGVGVPALLVRQVQTSVYMEDIIHRMAADGVDHILEIGPGKTLAGLVRKTEKGIAVRSVGTAQELAEAVDWLKGEAI